MYSQLQSKVFLYKDHEENFEESFPFTQKGNLLSITNFYELELLKIDLLCEQELDWQGIFFYKEIDGLKYIFSGGRFGYAGFFSSSPKKPVSEYLPSIELELKKLKVATCSLSVSFLNNNEIDSSWITTDISYLVANTKNSVGDSGLSFRKAMIRSNLSRNLKKAKKNGLFCKEFFDHGMLETWHENCHLPRISELNGKKWDLSLLKALIDNGTGSLLCVLNSFQEIVGGCFILKSNKVLEIFMMSTTRENQKHGTNHLLAEEIYLLAHKNSIKYINWQASNPPDSPLVRFKKEWNSEEKQFQILSRSWIDGLNRKFIEHNFKDCFVFPFSEI